MIKILSILFGTLAAALLGAFFYYMLCINHVSINEIGIAYDSRDGSIATQHPGWHITSPMVKATTISTLPFRVDLDIAHTSSRVLNVKIVRFVPEHAKDFIDTQGFRYYGGFGMERIFTPYAFSGKKYSFLEIIQD